MPAAATTPTEPRRTALAKPSATPSMIAVPAPGPMTSRPRSWARRFSATSSSRDTPSLNSSTSMPAPSALWASRAAYSPGTEMTARSPSARARLRGARARAARHAARLGGVEHLVRGGEPGVGPLPPHGEHQVVGARPVEARVREAHRRGLLAVGGRRHEAQRALDPVARPRPRGRRPSSGRCRPSGRRGRGPRSRCRHHAPLRPGQQGLRLGAERLVVGLRPHAGWTPARPRPARRRGAGG